MKESPLDVRREDSFAVFTLCRAERRNPLSEETLTALLEALHEIPTGDARGVILAAEGPVFSAGHDYRDLEARDLEGTRDLLVLCREVMQTIQNLPTPVIAQVEGLATAGGCQLVASCDLAVAGASARFAVPGGRGGWFCTTPGVALARAVGRKHALEMLLTGDPIDAETARAWGLVNRVVSDDRVADETRDLLGRATRGSRASKALGKRAFYRQVDLDTEDAYDWATEVMATSSQSDDAREGIRAFLEKRRPDFTDL
ncbi:MAG: enoyl-CoA hydratase-related protein [Myxococcota bacterium]|nr:enoyl-CoA hydratase-related protein [Myxococcota bacterium]